MKKQMYLAAFLLADIVLLTTSCNGDDDAVNRDRPQTAVVENHIQAGTWRITITNDSGVDKTAALAGYNFSFNINGDLVAINGTITRMGRWSVVNDSSSSSSVDDIELHILFNVPETDAFEDLNDDWDIVSSTATRTELVDTDSGPATSDRLIFEIN
jgi:hypothetical protein